VAFVGEVEEAAFDALAFEGGEEFEALVDGDAIIEFAVGDEGGCFEILRKTVRGKFFVEFAVFPGRAFEFPFGKPEFFGRAVFAIEIEDAGVADERDEAVGVAENPIDHVTAEGRAGGGDAGAIDVGLRFGPIGRFHDVFVNSAAPIAGNLFGERLAEAGGTMGIGRDDDVAVRGVGHGVPAKGKGIVPRALRAAVDEKETRIFARGVEVRRVENPGLDGGVESAGV
jgi:hypothetical protein